MACHHFDSIEINDSAKAAHAKGCAECIAMGDGWLHLRECLECGHVGCCDSSKNKHATKHFHAVKHPTIRSVEPGESWGWCYVDEVMVEFD
ncbi:UBP-type zinc finger domain-containing protein [Granulicella cerasi]|uniref:UBP-type zinc finger domain-containing protein n=1 Tax=Granulicella cerasi TaxID=741063 RepID=A0ABW1Z6H2_9BACT|nr:UBP-type zinc finger domain-containing protein [Granulicella cerasi]